MEFTPPPPFAEPTAGRPALPIWGGGIQETVKFVNWSNPLMLFNWFNYHALNSLDAGQAFVAFVVVVIILVASFFFTHFVEEPKKKGDERKSKEDSVQKN